MKRHAIFLLLALATAAQALEPLPQGPGLAGNFPGDRGVAGHPSVLLVEDFEGVEMDDLKSRWNEIENKDGEVLELVADHPEDGAGKQCLQVTEYVGPIHRTP